MYAKQSSLELLRYWDLSGEDSDTFASSVNIRHHRHHYHITTATMANTTNTTEITIVKAILPPDHRILSLHHASSSICAQSFEQHPLQHPFTFSSLLRHVFITISSISSSHRCHICPRHLGFVDILLVAPFERTPHLRPLPL